MQCNGRLLMKLWEAEAGFFLLISYFMNCFWQSSSKTTGNTWIYSVTQWQSGCRTIVNFMEKCFIVCKRKHNLLFVQLSLNESHSFYLFLCRDACIHVCNVVELSWAEQTTLYGAYRIWRCCYLVAIKMNVPEAIEMLSCAYHCSIC